MQTARLAGLALLIALGAVCVALAQEASLPPPATRTINFADDIKPLIEGRCQVCHGEQLQSNGLRLDSRGHALQGGYSGPAIAPGNSAESKLIRMVTGLEKGVVMPPGDEKLTAQQIGLLRAWIDQGAEWLATTAEAAPESPTTTSADLGTIHWSFQPVERPPPPAIKNHQWAKSPIDHFVLAHLEKEGIEPSSLADRRTLLRRVSLDLTGLPPTPAEVATFLTDDSPQAYEEAVDRLLKSPHYGEKWAMHWLDLARYADSDGYEADNSRPHAWRYRHWVINALNADMPFDRFSIEQIAGDQLPKATVEQRVATGFHRNTLKNREGGAKLEQFRFEEIVDRANTVGAVWLGLTVGCAQCHHHKYDPVSQKDYYSFFAFFNNLDEVNIDAPLAGEMGPYLTSLPGYRRQRDSLLAEYGVPELQPPWEEKMKLARAQPGKWTDWDHVYEAFQKYVDGGDKILDKLPSARTQKEIDALADYFVKKYGNAVSKERREELNFKELQDKLSELKNSFPAISEAQTVAESEDNRKTHIHIRGDWKSPGIEVEPNLPSVLRTLDEPTGTDKLTRVHLAKWIVSRDNPLTARVTVNRVWQEYFGGGLVATSEDFGTQGEKPSHPQLLDWLASEFMDGGWSLKHLHKTIVMSATYQQSSDLRPALQSRDPDNRLLARQSRLRLAGELARDAALSVSGLLYPKVGGRSVRPPLPEGMAKLSYGSSMKWEESEGKDRYRRGLYIHFQRSVPYPQLMSFDTSERIATQCRRERSNTPLQSLNLLNDPVFVEAARALAVRLLTETEGGLEERLRYGFELCLARSPKQAELQAMAEYYHTQTGILENDPESAEKLFALRLPGVSRVEGATWVGVSSVLLNLDEFITRE